MSEHKGIEKEERPTDTRRFSSGMDTMRTISLGFGTASALLLLSLLIAGYITKDMNFNENLTAFASIGITAFASVILWVLGRERR